MRLRTGGSRADIPAAPAAALSLLLVLLVGLSASFSSDRGLLVRLGGKAERATLPEPAGAVFLSVLPDASLVLDGEPVPFELLLSRVESKVGRHASRPVVLHVTDDAPYAMMVAVVDRLARGNTATGFRVRRLMVPTHAEIRDWARALGRDPFGSGAAAVAEDHP